MKCAVASIGRVEVAPCHRSAYAGQAMPFPSNITRPYVKSRDKRGKLVKRHMPLEIPDYFRPGSAPHLSTKPTINNFLEIDVLDRRMVEVQ